MSLFAIAEAIKEIAHIFTNYTCKHKWSEIRKFSEAGNEFLYQICLACNKIRKIHEKKG